MGGAVRQKGVLFDDDSGLDIEAIVRLQSRWRSRASCRVLQQSLDERQAAIIVQSVWRSCTARNMVSQHKASLKLHKAWRSHSQRKAFKEEPSPPPAAEPEPYRLDPLESLA